MASYYFTYIRILQKKKISDEAYDAHQGRSLTTDS